MNSASNRTTLDATPPVTDARRRMLISLAHPDDESFGLGGLLAHYASQGVAMSLICSTNGDVGTVDDDFLEGFESIGELRLHELTCAAETLGIKEVITYGYRDSGMVGSPDNDHPRALVQADVEQITGRVVREIRRIRPQVIITFDPYGGYGHPDHIFMHKITTRAFHEAADPERYPAHLDEGLEPYRPAKLYYTGFPRLPLRLMVWTARLQGQDPRHMGRNGDMDLQAALDNVQPIHARINVGRYQRVWDDAAECHASQQNPRQSNSLLTRIQRWIFRHQDLTRAYPPPQPGEPLEHDLFSGID